MLALISAMAVVLAAVLPGVLTRLNGDGGSHERALPGGEPPVVTPPGQAPPGRPAARRTRLLVVIDTSGSMGLRMTGPGELRRITAAVRGVRTGVKVAPGSFEMGLWESRGAGHYELVPFARLSTPGHRERLLRALDKLLRRQRRDPGTPFYTTTKNGILALEALGGGAAVRNALVFVTDAGDHPPRELVESGMATSPAQLDELLGETSVDVYVTAAWGRCGTLFAKLPSFPMGRCYPVRGRRDVSRRLRSILEALHGTRE